MRMIKLPVNIFVILLSMNVFLAVIIKHNVCVIVGYNTTNVQLIVHVMNNASTVVRILILAIPAKPGFAKAKYTKKDVQIMVKETESLAHTLVKMSANRLVAVGPDILITAFPGVIIQKQN